MPTISNMNSVLIKNQPGYETLAVLRELKKLGLIKTSKAKPKQAPKMIEDIKQPSDMVGYTKTLGPNQFPPRIITPGMTQQQIEDINRETAAKFVALRGEVEQQRIEDIQAQQGQRFSDIQKIGTAVGQIVNPLVERFRGSTFPAQARGDQPIDPFQYARSGTVPPEFWLPETTDVPMSETLNPGGPKVTAEFATTLYPVEESGNIEVPLAPRIVPQEKIGGASAGMSLSAAEMLGLSPEFKKTIALNEIAVSQLGLNPIPKQSSKKNTIQKYYNDLTEKLGIQDTIASGTKEDFYNEIITVLESYT